jgi:hypothetical protein
MKIGDSPQFLECQMLINGDVPQGTTLDKEL